MSLPGCSHTLPERPTPPAPIDTARHAATLPARVRANGQRRASHACHAGPPRHAGGNALTYTIRYFLASKKHRAAMQAERAQVRLAASMHRFIDEWKRREIDELRPTHGARLLGAACVAARPQGHELAQAVVMAILRRCLSTIEQPEELSQLYNDLTAPRPVTRELAERQNGKLRGIANHLLDALEQAVADTLAERMATPLIGRLLVIQEQTADAADRVRATLEQLHGIGLWLSSASRPPARILSYTLDLLSDDELGQLAAQAWPDLSARDERHGAEAPCMRAALAFIQACEGSALTSWREALQLQLDGRKRMVAARTARMVEHVVDPGRLGDAMRSVYTQLDNAAIVLTGKLHNANLLRASVRTDVLLQVLRHLPESWRGQGLRALPARELSSIKSSLAVASGAAATDASVTALIDSVQADMLAADMRSAHAALAALHEAIALRDRPVAIHRLGALAGALRELGATLEAFNIAMPASLEDSLRHVLAGVCAMLPDGRHQDDAGALRGLSDAELGQLRQALPILSGYGTLPGKNALKAAITLRSGIPARADRAMDALLATLADADGGAGDTCARLRDLGDILVRLNERLLAMGAETSADANDAMTAGIVQRAVARIARTHPAWPGAAVREAVARSGLAGETLLEPLFALADWISRQPRDEAVRLDRCAARLTIAARLGNHLHDAVQGRDETGGGRTDEAGGHGPHAAVGIDARALRAVLAGEYGVEWDAQGRIARPCVSRAMHAALEARLQAAFGQAGDGGHAAHGQRVERSDGGGRHDTRSIQLYAGDGTSTWFLVDDRFARDILDGPGMALAVEGVNARGETICSPGFAVRLDKDARLAAMGAALHALRELAGSAMGALLRCLHGGVADAYMAAMAAAPERLPLHLPDGTRAQFPSSPPAATEYRVRREANGEYSVDVFLTWRGSASLPRPDESALDPSRSFITACFVLAMDAQGRMHGLRETVDLRYRLVKRQPPR
ncbi:hypothetical protein CAL12_01605 [Bordetella genomosp. 8]|uniref:Uncharacterized protein n=1 Tax=Bordetella genomosp. 8 TaxID=1416806 RepID=A0A1W6YF40_9BORD|nr:hypothetical protein [Bordetella genomosp. 8]ARP79649.1 hypothetical protein CAL12_01605 [Bordetella genomosp. 8]